jgi:hypothetical protein
VLVLAFPCVHSGSIPPREPDRFEPLPSIAELPAWIWRKLGRRLRIGIAVVAALAVAGAIAVVPAIREAERERAAADRRERAEQRAQLVRELKAEQRPRRDRSGSVAEPGAGARARLAARAGLIDDVQAAILADARRRVRADELDGPIRRLACEPFPRSVDDAGAERDLTRRRGRYACVAVTSEFGSTEESVGGVIGHTYRVLVDFETGRYGFCKVTGQSGPSREQLVTTPRACGGR